MKKIFIIHFSLFIFLVPAFAATRKVHTIGDSTMSDYRPAATPKRGWGMYLQAFFLPDSVRVNNRGKSGASTRTFYETENLWPSVRTQMQPGDYLIIQFAHNDEKCKGQDVYHYNDSLRLLGQDTTTDMRGTEPNTTYKDYLRLYVREARELGVTPILMSPICRAYFQKDGTISPEGRHNLTNNNQSPITNHQSKDYVRCMREVAAELNVPFLDMTAATYQAFESLGRDYCMAHFFNCGDKTHTSAQGGMAVANLAYDLIAHAPELAELASWTVKPSDEALAAYSARIEDAGRAAAFSASGTPFSKTISDFRLENLQPEIKNHQSEIINPKSKILPPEGSWPAGEIDEVANRYVEYTLSAPKKKALVIESIELDVCAYGGDGMNIHINAGFGDMFRDVVTLYENTALPKNRPIHVRLTEPLLVPAGETLVLRVLPWYDSRIRPQTGKSLRLSPITISGKEIK